VLKHYLLTIPRIAVLEPQDPVNLPRAIDLVLLVLLLDFDNDA
jgi:hypothetical protein